jgi:restriction system protein
MAKGSGSSGSYRDWEAAQRADQRARDQATKKAEADRKARERDQAGAESAARDEEAAAKTGAVERRVAELENLLSATLTHDPRISFASLRRTPAVPPLDLGLLATPVPAPEWTDYEPEAPRGVQRLFGSTRRQQEALDEATARFAEAQADQQRRETARQRQVAAAREAWRRQLADKTREVEASNARVDELAAGFREHDRFAVSKYVQIVLDRSRYPSGFPKERHAGYVPESALLAVEWFLPTMEIVPADKTFRHVKTRKVVEATPRPAAEAHRLYLSVIAQIALRTLREVFAATPEDMVSTVVFNGLVDTIDPRTGIAIKPHFITLRATRDQFAPLVLDQPKFSPVQCVQKYFFADVSQHPEELVAVEPVMPFSMADPRIIEPIDVLSTIDQRPNLLELKPQQFEAFIQNLFTKEGLDVKLFRAGGDGGIDCMAYDPDPVRGGKIAIQAKLYTKTVAPTHVRDLWGTVQHEGALKGIMVTTWGFGPDSYKFAAGKPLSLIDGTGLLALCQKHNIPARILKTSSRKPGP